MSVLRDSINLISPVKHLSPVTTVYLILRLQHNVKIGSSGSTLLKKLILTRVRKTLTGIDKTCIALTTIQHLEPLGIQGVENLKRQQNARQTLIVQRATCA